VSSRGREFASPGANLDLGEAPGSASAATPFVCSRGAPRSLDPNAVLPGIDDDVSSRLPN